MACFLANHSKRSRMKDRIRTVMESQHMSQQVFAEFIQISPATLSSIYNGRTKPTLNIVEAICNKIPNISTEWLMFGRGSMYSSSSGESNDQQADQQDAIQGSLDFVDSPAPSQVAPQRHVSSVAVQTAQVPTQVVNVVEKPQRQITEIRIFYDDQTWETFVPKK